MKTKNLVSFFSSLSTKVAIIMLICVTTAVSTTSIAFLRSTEKAMERMNSNYAQTMAEDYARSIDGAALQGGFELTADIFDNLVGGTQMMGVPSSYMYVCDANGIMKYHPTASKIGQKVENAAINGLVAEMQKGNKPAPGALVYEYSGIKKIAGFAISESNYIVVMTADYDDTMSEYTATHKHANNVNLLNIVWFTFAGLLIFKIFLKTIPAIVNIVGETADFNFKENPELIKLANRKDEIGLIAKSVKEMRSSLKEIVTDISNSSKELTSNIDDLKAGAITINTMCTDNSATTEQLAAGMEETSATAENINGNIATMISNAKGIDELALEGEKLADDVSKRAKELKNITIDSTKKTESIYKSVKEKADSAIENAQVVSKINEMTDQIMEISSQTSLLALNASIEAARAGESGRGFAVVATEIGNLATQTLKTVENIDAMVSAVVSSVAQMQECLEETTTFIGENVVNDYKEFEKVSDQYDSDAGEFKESMTAIRDGVTELNDTIDTVADSISGISTTINEAAHGVSGISENTHDIALKTDDTVEKANECENEITNLDDIVSKFIL